MSNKSAVYKSPGVYVKEVDLFIYSPYTNKWYNSRKELNKDMRRLKLMKIFKNEI